MSATEGQHYVEQLSTLLRIEDGVAASVMLRKCFSTASNSPSASAALQRQRNVAALRGHLRRAEDRLPEHVAKTLVQHCGALAAAARGDEGAGDAAAAAAAATKAFLEEYRKSGGGGFGGSARPGGPAESWTVPVLIALATNMRVLASYLSLFFKRMCHG